MARNEIRDSQRDETHAGNADGDETEEDIKTALGKVIAVKVADAGVLRKTVNVTVPRESIKKELDKEFKQIITEAVVPGFRRGRAPRRLVEKRFGGEVGTQVQTRLVSNAYLAAIEKEDLKVLGDPLVWIKPKEKSDKAGHDAERLMDMPTALQQMRLPEDGPLEFRCEVEVKPSFEMPTLEGVEIKRPDLTITDEDVLTEIDRTRARRGSWSPVVNGKVQEDDMLVCDMVMTVDGKEVKKVENAAVAARAQRIEGVTFEDMGDKLKGLKVGDAKTFEGELTDDYEVADLRGKKARFEFKINDIKRLELPPLDKQYLTNIGFDSEKEYRDWVRKQMENRLEFEIKRGMRAQARQYLLDHTKLDVPEGISSRQTDRAVLRRIVDLRRQGVPEAEIEKHADELKTVAREEATTELKLYFIVEEIAEKLKVEVSEEEINAQIAGIARAYNRRFDRVRDDLAKSGSIESLYLQIRDDKCLDWIVEKAKITKADLKKEAAAAKKPIKPAHESKTAEAKPADAEKAEKPKKEVVAKSEQPKPDKPKAEKKPAKGKAKG